MKIVPATPEDISEIFRLYRCAQDFQREKKTVVVWPDFPHSLVEQEVAEGRQYKIVIDDKVACVFALAFSDPDIWYEKDEDQAVYIHRIATNPEFRGHHLVQTVIDWTVKYARENHLQYVRLDTLDENTGLIKVYTSAGFEFLGMHDLKNTENLPEHYQSGYQVALFEIKL